MGLVQDKQEIADKRGKLLDGVGGRAEIVDLTASGWTEEQLQQTKPELARAQLYRWIFDRADIIVTNDRDQAQALLEEDTLNLAPIEGTSLYVYQKTLCADLIGRAHGDKAGP